MLLIDAANINSGGGIVLLKYLVEKLESNNLSYFVITDPRWSTNTINPEKQEFLIGGIRNRAQVIKKIISKISPKKILFFGNFPSPFKLSEDIKSITYIQNRMMINWKNTASLNLKTKIYRFLTRIYLKNNISNTNCYCFQNSLTLNDFIQSYGKLIDIEYKVLPFYKLATTLKINDFINRENAFIYVSDDVLHKNHINLFKAWEILYKNNITPKLYVTLNFESKSKSTAYMDELIAKGVNIVNLGLIDQEKVFEFCNNVKFCIFPSLIETIGLNLIEASHMGCKVITSNADYVNEIIKPSLVFNPLNPYDIANKVEFALNNDLENPEIILENKIDELIQLCY